MATDSAQSTAPSTTRQLWQVPVFLLGIGALIAVPLLRPHWTNDHTAAAWQLRSARQALEQSPADLPQAVSRGLRVIEKADRFQDLAAEAHFVVGSACLRLADEPGANSDSERRNARQHFEQAQTLGVAPNDQAKLNYRLAKVRLLTGEATPQVLTALETAVESADDPADGYGLLAQAYARQNPPDLAKAAAMAKRQVDRLRPSNDTRAQTLARFRLGDLYFQQKKVKDARQALEYIPNDGSEQYFASRLLLAQSYEETEEWEPATAKWEQARQNPRLAPADKGRLLYHLGQCYVQQKRPAEAAGVWTETLAMGGDEAQAAALRLADLRLDTDARSAAVEALFAALNTIQCPDDYRNTVISLDEARQVVGKAAQACRSKGEWDAALRVAELYGRLSPAGGGDLAIGLTADEWANALTEQARLAPPDQAAALTKQARTQFRAAGLSYEKAALKASPGPEQVNWLITSANRLQRANDLVHAVDVLTELTRLGGVPAAAEQMDGVWNDLAWSLHRLQKYDIARDAYQHCLRPDSPYLAHARLGLARIDIVEGRFDEADRALEENRRMLLGASQPNPELQEQTMYALAEVEYQRQDAKKPEQLREYNIAAKRLEMALEQYPNSPAALRARFMLALCYWNPAAIKCQILNDALINKTNLGPQEKQEYERAQMEYLQKAAEQCDKVVEQLGAQQQTRNQLTADEAAYFQRASYLGAESCFWMRKYEEAVARYAGLALRYQGMPEELLARYQIIMIYSTYDKNLERAEAEYERFRAAFDRIPESAYDGSMEQHKRAFWAGKLDDATKVLEAARKGTPVIPPR
jgi:hypothetical protein